MTDQPRLTDAARAAIEGAGYAHVSHASPTDIAPKPSVLSPDYLRGWNDCRTVMLKFLHDRVNP